VLLHCFSVVICGFEKKTNMTKQGPPEMQYAASNPRLFYTARVHLY